MENTPGMERLLAPFKVLDLTAQIGHSFFSKILADLGAQVTHLEKPGLERDSWWIAYNSHKPSLPIDISLEPSRVLPLIPNTDILVEDFPPGFLQPLGLDYPSLSRINPALIMTSISPFGQSGPYQDMKASDLELMALSGILHGMGDPDRPPVRISFPQSDLITSAEAAVGTLIALCHRESSGLGQQVDVSAQESVHCMLENRVRHQGVLGSKTRLGGSHPVMPSAKLERDWKYHHLRHPQIWQCKNGHIAFLLHPFRVAPETNWALVKYMDQEGDLPDLVRQINWDTFDWVDVSPEDARVIWDTFARFFKRHTYQELYQIALKERIQLFPGYTVKDLLADEQLNARQYWLDQTVPSLGKTLKFPGPFARVHFPPPAPHIPAPITSAPALPLQGVKVLDFTWVVIGPWITQWLAVYGAEVVKIESSKAGASGRRGPGMDFAFVGWNTSKKSMVLNLKAPGSKELAQKLVAWADIVVENFSPGTMQRMGLGYQDLLKLNPRIIMLSASMMGATGPHTSQPGLGLILSSLSGFTELTGWPDRLPVTAHGPYTDVISGRMGAIALFAALDHQKRTGQGCCIDLSQFEASLPFLTPLILDYQLTGNLMHRMGNRSLTDSPHGVFPCLGQDLWCALSVSSQTEWQAFCQALDKPHWLNDPRFAAFQNRKQNEDLLEQLIAQWTSQYSPQEVMSRLQQAGVKAGVVEGPDDLLNDPQFAYRKHFVTLKHAELGEYDYVDSGFRLSRASPTVNPAPLFSEHTRYVATQILGLSQQDFETRLREGGFA